jgi:hypothetical protein amacA2_00589
MLYQINLNGTIRIWGYGLQTFTIMCLLLQEMLNARRIKLWGTNIILWLLIIYQFIVSLNKGTIYLPYTFIDIVLWPLSIITYSEYVYRTNIETEKQNKSLIYYCLMCAVSIPLIMIHLTGNGNIGQVIFLTYFCLTALPLVLLLVEKEKYRNLCIVFCVAILVASTKRTGTMALLFGLFVMAVLNAHIQGSLRKKWKQYFSIFLVICIGSIVLLYLDKNSSLQIFERFSRLSTDGGSGRDVIWNIVLQAYKESNFMERVFGHGFQSVYYSLRPGGFSRFAHNSYIEYLYDYGIIGLALLLVFVMSMIVFIVKLMNRKSKYTPVMGLLLVITIFLGMFSYFFEESNIIQPIAVSYGIILGLARKEGKENEI